MNVFVMMDGRKCVGEDAAGNKFWEIPAPGQIPNPRREIEYNARDMVSTCSAHWSNNHSHSVQIL